MNDNIFKNGIGDKELKEKIGDFVISILAS